MTEPTMRDFSSKRKPISFTIEADVFHGPAVLPAAVFGELMEAAKGLGSFQMTDAKQVDAALERVAEFTDLILTPETAPRFRERLLSRTEPLDLVEQVLPIVQWLAEVYGMRPTQAPSNSVSGSDGAGGISTDITPSEV